VVEKDKDVPTIYMVIIFENSRAYVGRQWLVAALAGHEAPFRGLVRKNK
jgi:hypothetical protein